MMFAKFRIGLVLFAVMAVALVAAQPARAAVVFTEDFESYSAGDLISQSTWTGSGTTSLLDVGTADGFFPSKHLHSDNTEAISIADYEHAVSGLTTSAIYSLEFDVASFGALATGNTSVFGFAAGSNSDALWWRGTNVTGALKTWRLSGDGTVSTGDVELSISGVQSLRIDVNKNTNLAEGFYDTGSGFTSIGTIALTAGISGVDGVGGIYDASTGRLPFAVDNIVVTTTAVPEPSSLILVVTGMAGVFLALRRQK